MAAHLSEEQIAHYTTRRLAPEELLRVDDHISECANCRQRIASAAELRKAFQDPREWDYGTDDQSYVDPKEHLTYEQLGAYVDGKTGADVATLRAHLEVCRRCSEEFRDLNTFKTELASSKEQHAEGWWPRFVARWLTVRSVAFALGGCAVVVFAIAVGIRQMSFTKGGPSTETATIQNPALAGIKELTPEQQIAIIEAVSNKKIETSEALQEFKGEQEVLLGQAEETLRFNVLTPVGQVVADDRPFFHWQPLAGAKSYSVAIFDANLNPVLSSPPLHTPDWTASHPLNRGQLYVWQVTAQVGNGKSVTAPKPPSPEAKFRVLDQKSADEIARFQKKHPESHLALGILYAQVGAREAGEQELRLIRGTDPNYALAQELLKSIQEIPHR